MRAYKEATRLFTNHPGRCAATPPLKGGEWTPSRNLPDSRPPRVATCRTVLINSQFHPKFDSYRGICGTTR